MSRSQNQQNDLEELEELRRDLAPRTAERDGAFTENNLLKEELLRASRNASASRTLPL